MKAAHATRTRRLLYPSVLPALTSIVFLIPAVASALAFDPVVTGMTNVMQGVAVWGDYDNDGDLDVLLTGSNGATPVAIVYRNDGGGTFTNISAGLTGVSLGGADWGDYDNDGDLDIVLTGLDATATRITRVYRNNGGGSFTSVGSIPGHSEAKLAWGDYDNDGDLDLVFTGLNAGATLSGAWVYRNDGGNVFVDIAANVGGARSGGGAWGDYDNDKDLDVIASGGLLGTGHTTLSVNNGGGSFTPVIPIGPTSQAGFASVAWGDYDNDGDLDFFLSGIDVSEAATTRVYRNDGTTSFTNIAAAGLVGLYNSSGAWGDYDNDGDLDLAVSGYTGAAALAAVYRYDGGTTYTNLTSIGVILSGVSEGYSAWGDYDNDGDLDVLMIGKIVSGTPLTTLYKNNNATANTTPAAPGAAAASINGFTATFSWNAPADGQTPANALSYNLRVGTTAGGNDVLSGMAASGGYRRVARLGNANENHGWRLSLPKQPYLYWGVQAVDGAWAGGPFAIGLINYAPITTAIEDVPGDQGGHVRIHLTASVLDKASEVSYPIAQYGIWRRVDAAMLAAVAAAKHAGPGAEPADPYLAAVGARDWNGRVIAGGSGSSSGQVAAALPPGTWEWVGSVPALQQAAYLAAVPTVEDSTVAGVAWSVFVVTSHTTTPSVWFASYEDSGYSVDNIAPGAPTGFGVGYNSGGANHLGWDPAPETDFQVFRVYRSTNPGFVPGPGTLVNSTASTTWNDPIANGYLYYYKITAVDHAGNESPPTSPGTTTGVGDSRAPKTFALYPNVPNPFNPATVIRYDVPVQGTRVVLRIYDVAGRAVRTLIDEPQPAGRRSVNWDGRDDAGQPVSSGVYLFRLRAQGFEQSRKMVLMK